MALFASTSAAEGAKVFKKCLACHSIADGGANKFGPALWGVLGRPAGSVPGYKYSKAMAAHGKNWAFDEMNGFLSWSVSGGIPPYNYYLFNEFGDLEEVGSLDDENLLMENIAF